MKPLYITLIQAHTGLGSAARLLTGYAYTHIAVCRSRRLDDFVTFSRRHHFLPLDAGFMHEYRDYYAFGQHRQVRIKVFRLPVRHKESDQAIDRFLADCEQDDTLLFNLFSMLTMPLLHGFEVDHCYNCMSFVSKLIQLSGTVTMDQPYYRYSIRDLDALLTPYFFFEGMLPRTDSPAYREYMRRFPMREVLSGSAHTVLALSKRLIRRKK